MMYEFLLGVLTGISLASIYNGVMKIIELKRKDKQP